MGEGLQKGIMLNNVSGPQGNLHPVPRERRSYVTVQKNEIFYKWSGENWRHLKTIELNPPIIPIPKQIPEISKMLIEKKAIKIPGHGRIFYHLRMGKPKATQKS